jgi:GDP-4-dehydro-6-deoxy-D-mannose reductase
VTSSSAVYGRTPSGRPVSERTPVRPVTHYGASKLAQEEVAMRYSRSHGIPVVRTRAFNLLGPGLSSELACGAFANAIARREREGTTEPIRTGNLDSARDFTDVRDAVQAYAALAARGRAGAVYNICSGAAVTLDRCLRILLDLAARPLATEVDPARLQRDDVPIQVGDAGRVRALTGWRPSIPLERALSDMLDDSRARSVAS